jgi:dTDP-4-dehydrorhamnose reductase
MKKIIIGKNGLIAKELFQRGSYEITSSQVSNIENDIYLNLLESDKFDYSIFNKDTRIILLAAISSPDECNNNYAQSYKINVIGTKYFIEESIKKGAKVLFFSSDVIYGNQIDKVDETAETNPFGNYAEMKNEIEKAFEFDSNFKVFRLSYVLSNKDKYLSYLKNSIDKKEVAEVFHPFNRKVIYIEDVLDAIESILEKWDDFNNQKFNICGEEDISRKDIADFYNEVIGNKLEYSITEPSEEFWKARPKNINITSLYLEKLLGRKPIKIKDSINKIIKEEK